TPGSRPSPPSPGPGSFGPSPFACRYDRAALATLLIRTWLLGPRLLPRELLASYLLAERRPWKYLSALKFWPIKLEPTTWPLTTIKLPLAWSWKATWLMPVMTSG